VEQQLSGGNRYRPTRTQICPSAPGGVGRGGGEYCGQPGAAESKRQQNGRKLKVKAKFTLEQSTKAQMGSRGILYAFLTSAIDGVG
jgi:radical SAM superfamily enzyme